MFAMQLDPDWLYCGCSTAFGRYQHAETPWWAGCASG
jgi:muramidase (phage lysozyme)